jgi:hypothetical protein
MVYVLAKRYQEKESDTLFFRGTEEQKESSVIASHK